MSSLYCGNPECGVYLGSLGADSCLCGWVEPVDAGEIEAAATAPLLARIAELEAANAKLEQLCDETYVAQGADAYNHACEEMERFQKAREDAGKEIGTTKSLCDGLAWLYEYVDELEAALAEASKDAQPIPDHELVTMYDERPTCDADMIAFAREVERRHGIDAERQHITDGSPCWCNPDVDYTDPETGASVIVHRRPQ